MKEKCGVCLSNTAKYKCPMCLLPFCSVPCNRIHKQTPCSAAPSSQPKIPQLPSPTLPVPEEGLLTSHQLARLDDDPEVLRKTRDQRVLATIARIDSASDRAAALEKEMRNPEFVELCDDILAALGMREDASSGGETRE